MTWENVYVLVLAFGAIVLLATEKAHLTTIGVGLMVAVSVPRLIAAEDAIAGLATPALVTIASLFVVGEGFLRTGAASMVADNVLRRTGNSEASVIFLIMAMSAVLSAFVNNTLVVVTFLPVITSICRETGFFPSRMLIPLSYASIVGGMCTLVGTSTNLLVSGQLEVHGEPGLEMFSITPAGVILAGVTVLYLGFAGRRLLPTIHTLSAMMSEGSMKEYVMEITISSDSPLIGESVAELGRSRTADGAKVMMVVRREAPLWPPFGDMTVEAGDILMLGGSIQNLTELQRDGAGIGEDSYDPRTMSFFELALAPSSSWVGRKVGDVHLKSEFGAVVVAVQRSGRHIRDRVSRMTLQGGDVLLVFGDDRSKQYLRHSSDFHLIEGVQEALHDTRKAPWAFAIILMVVVLFVTGVVHYSTAALLGALAMTATGCLSVHDTPSAVKWPIILFIGGMIALSRALENTGTMNLVSHWIMGLVPGDGTAAAFPLLAVLFASTVFLTEFLTNNAVAVLMTPLAVTVARQSGFEHTPYVMAVAVGASCSFANPLGYQTNLMVMGPGGYRFRHFIKVGLPLDLLLIVAGLIAIPMIWPLHKSDERPSPEPQVTWIAGQSELALPLDEVAPGDRVTIGVTLSRATYVYVTSYAPSQGQRALFPSEQLKTTLPPNPLPPGAWTLPGSMERRELAWPVAPDAGSISYQIVLSPRPLSEVERALAQLEQVGNSGFQDFSMGTYAPAAGMATVPPKSQLPVGFLGEAYHALVTGKRPFVHSQRDPGVLLSTLHVTVR